jgi:cytidine deaminase
VAQIDKPIAVPFAVLSAAAWKARDNSRVLGKTPVGCAALDESGRVYAGCNIEHKFRSHDIHAEVSAVSALVSAGGRRLVAVLIAAERDLFTPCGACLDWIFELGGPDCLVLVQKGLNGEAKSYRARELMPHYPR